MDYQSPYIQLEFSGYVVMVLVVQSSVRFDPDHTNFDIDTFKIFFISKSVIFVSFI